MELWSHERETFKLDIYICDNPQDHANDKAQFQPFIRLVQCKQVMILELAQIITKKRNNKITRDTPVG